MDWLRYSNQNATRNFPLSDRLTGALGFLPELGVEMEVFSGGQPAKGSGAPRVGSTRHDHGNAADVFFYRDGRRLTWENPQDIPVLQEIVRRGSQAGLTGFGAGANYMQPGSMHIGFGAPAVWGAGGKGDNAPEWLREAYYGARGTQTPVDQGDPRRGTFATGATRGTEAPPGETPQSYNYGQRNVLAVPGFEDPRMQALARYNALRGLMPALSQEREQERYEIPMQNPNALGRFI